MGKRQFAGRVVSCLLVSVLLVTSMTGCGKKKSSGVSLEEAKKIDKNVIFKQEDLEGILEPGEEAIVIENTGGKIRIAAHTEKGKCRLITFNPDGSDVQAVNFGPDKDFYVSSGTFDKDGNAYLQCYEGKRNIEGALEDVDESDAGEATSVDASATDSSDGGAATADASTTDASTADASAEAASNEETEASEDAGSIEDSLEEGKSYFVKLDASGKELAKVDIDQFSPKDAESPDEEFYIYNLIWTEKYGVVCLSSTGIITFDEKNGPQTIVERKKLCGENGWINGLAKLSENEALLTYYDDSDDGGEINAIFDLDKKEVGKKLEGFAKYGNYSFFTGDGSNIYASDEKGIYKYDMKGSKLNKIVDFKDSNIGNGGYMWIEAIAISDTEFVASIPSEDANEATNSLVRLTKVNPEDVADKIVITLMARWMDSQIGSAIMKFNRSNDKYMIKIINYDELYQDDWETANKQFNLDITSGKAADIINISGNEASLRKYVDKGILLDLTPAFEKGGPLGDIEFVPNVAEMMKLDGKYYTFMPSFAVQTYSAKKKFLDGKTALSFKEWEDIIEKNGANYDLAIGTYISKNNLGSYFWTYYGDKFVDWNNKKCNFNDPDFIDYLNFVNKFPDEEHMNEGKENGDWVPDEKYVQEDKTIFTRTYISGADDWSRYKQMTFKEDFELIGFPNNSGENLAAISGNTFAINSKTEHKDVIYDLIRSILTEGDKSWYGFSSVKSKFEESFEEATKEKPDNEVTYWWDSVTEKQVKLKPLTQEEAQKLHDYILAIKNMDREDEEVGKIVGEETSAFYSGQKTAEQVAEIIQNRVTTYLNENS